MKWTESSVVSLPHERLDHGQTCTPVIGRQGRQRREGKEGRGREAREGLLR